MIPPNACLVTTSPLVQRSDSIWSYCSSRYFGRWSFGFGEYFNECAGRPVLVNSFATVEGFDRTIFFPVQGGDTVRFAYWSGNFVDRCEVSQGATIWNVHLFRRSGCYPADSVVLRIQFAYADSGFAKLDVQALRDTLVFGDTTEFMTPIAIVAKSTGGREVKIPDTVSISIAINGLTNGDGNKAVLRGPLGDTSTVLTGIQYHDARAGKVRVVSTSRPSLAFASFLVEASAPGQSATGGGDTIVLKRKLIYSRFLQGDPAWKDSIYDSTPDSIGKWG